MTDRCVGEYKKGIAAIRKQVRVCADVLTWIQAQQEAEILQHMAFDLKDLVTNSGTWAERQETQLLEVVDGEQ